jgi:hypothetical protein
MAGDRNLESAGQTGCGDPVDAIAIILRNLTKSAQ